MQSPAQLSESLKQMPDDYLMQAMQSTDGMVPQFLILAELQRRKQLRNSGGGPAPTTTVAQDVVQGGGPDPSESGIATMAGGGLVAMAGGGLVSFAGGGLTDMRERSLDRTLDDEQLFETEEERKRRLALRAAKAELDALEARRRGRPEHMSTKPPDLFNDPRKFALPDHRTLIERGLGLPGDFGNVNSEAGKIRDTSTRNTLFDPTLLETESQHALRMSKERADKDFAGNYALPKRATAAADAKNPYGAGGAGGAGGNKNIVGGRDITNLTTTGIAAALPEKSPYEEKLRGLLDQGAETYSDRDAYGKLQGKKDLVGLTGQAMEGTEAELRAMRDELAADKKRAPWMAVMRAGIGAMQGNSPYALQNFGSGAQQGIDSYTASQQEMRKRAVDQMTAASQIEAARRGEKMADVKTLSAEEDAVQARNAAREGRQLTAAAQLEGNFQTNQTSRSNAKLQAETTIKATLLQNKGRIEAAIASAAGKSGFKLKPSDMIAMEAKVRETENALMGRPDIVALRDTVPPAQLEAHVRELALTKVVNDLTRLASNAPGIYGASGFGNSSGIRSANSEDPALSQD